MPNSFDTYYNVVVKILRYKIFHYKILHYKILHYLKDHLLRNYFFFASLNLDYLSIL